MSGRLRRFVVALLVLPGSVLAVAVLSAVLQTVPLPDAQRLAEVYWGSAEERGFIEAYTGYVWFMFQNIWVLWLIPLFALLAVFLAWRARNDEEVEAYLERIHLVEMALKEARDQADETSERWDSVNRKLDELLEHAAEAWLVVDKNQAVRRWNFSAMNLARLTNPGLETLEGHLLGEIVSSQDLYEAMGRALQDGAIWNGETYAPNVHQWLLIWLFPLGEDVAVLLRDVSASHREQGFLLSSEMLVRQLVEESEVPVAVLDNEWRYLFTSRRWAGLMGFPPSSGLVGQDHRKVLPDFPADIRVLEHQLLQGESVEREEERRVVQGREITLNWKISPWRDVGGRVAGFIFSMEDVTEHLRLRQQVVQAEERENALAYSDALTGLPNRQLFNDRLNMALAQAYRQLGKVALFFLDLDGFKQVNDQLGHDYGDLLLKQVAERLKTTVRKTDTVARLGGDEFTIILAIRDKTDAEQVADKLLKIVHAPYDLNGKIVSHVGTSIGVALYPQDGAQPADLIKKADAAMYVAKQAGKNTYRFSTVELKIKA